MPTPLHVLLLEDQPTDAALVLKELRRAGYEPKWERVDSEEAYSQMLERNWDIVLSDFAMPQFTGLQALEILRARGLETPFIIISGTIGEDAAVSAIKLGASDYFLKDRLARLGSAVAHSIDQSRLRAERRAANVALRESEERFRQLAEHIGEVFWLFDIADNRTLYVSPAYETIWGRPRPAEGSLRDHWLDTMHPDDRERVAQAIADRHNGGGFDIEYRILRPDNTVRWIHDRAFAVHDSLDNVVRRIAGLARDITERKESEESLRLLSSALQQSRESIVITDADLQSPGPRILFVNGGFTKMTGYEAHEVLGKSPRILQGPRTDREVVQRLRSELESGGVFFGETINYRKDGTPFNLEWRVAPVLNTSGITTHFVAVQRDVTQRKRAEQELLWKTAFLEAQVHSSSDGVLVIDEHGRQILKNEQLSEIWKAPPCMLDGLHDSEATQWASMLTTDPEGFRKRVEFLYSHPDISAHDEIQLLDGRTIDRYSAPVRGNDGTHYGRIWTFRDITNRKRDVQKLKEQAALIDEARDAILVRSLDHRILFWSKGAERLYGWTVDEAVGKQANELLYRKQAPFLEATQITIDKGEWRGELQQITKAGTTLTVESRWTLLRDETGQPKSLLAINSDITERKKVEAQFLRAQRLESIGTLAGGIAHDLNNVLAPILMGASLLKLQSTDDTNTEVLNLIENSVQRGSELVKQVLSFARGVEGARVAVHIGDVINELAGIVRSTFPKHINFTSSVSDDIWIVESDPTQIHQVFLNLCVNARDAMPNGGKLSVTADNITIDAQHAAQQQDIPEGSYVRIRISDTGTGIAKENIEKIFEPFFTTKEIGKGTGLGLSTTLGIIRSNGGVINVESELGKGTTFVLHMPVPAENSDLLAEAAQDDEDLYGHGECVLLVDDERAILNITRHTLQSYGYEVLTAENGAQALGIFAERRHEIAVVVMDMMMPVLSGSASIVAMRHLDPGVKIIAASGLKDKESATQDSQVKVEHFLSKPYSAKALLAAIRECLAEPPFPIHHHARYGAVTLKSGRLS